MKVLLIVCNAVVAHHAGMNVTGAHRDQPNVEFHWPALGTERLMGKTYDVVIVDSSVFRTNDARKFIEEARMYLTRRPSTVWIEP